MLNKNTLVRHHLLECILWPNTNGTFRIINNSAERLIELGIYYDYKLCITITNSEHWKLHHASGTFSFGKEFRDKVSKATKAGMKKVPKDKLAYWKGKKQTDEQKQNKVKKIKERRDAYLLYKANGGELKWNDFQRHWNDGKLA